MQQCLAFLTHPGYPDDCLSTKHPPSLQQVFLLLPATTPIVSVNTDGDSKETLSCSVCYRWQNAQSQTGAGIQGNSSLKRHQGECEASLDPKPGKVITYSDQNQVSGSVSFTAGGSHLVQTAPGPPRPGSFSCVLTSQGSRLRGP